MPDESDLTIKGSAIAGFGLAQVLFASLRNKGLINQDEANGLLDIVLSGLENVLPADDPAVQRARQMIDLIGRSL